MKPVSPRRWQDRTQTRATVAWLGWSRGDHAIAQGGFGDPISEALLDYSFAPGRAETLAMNHQQTTLTRLRDAHHRMTQSCVCIATVGTVEIDPSLGTDFSRAQATKVQIGNARPTR